MRQWWGSRPAPLRPANRCARAPHPRMGARPPVAPVFLLTAPPGGGGPGPGPGGANASFAGAGFGVGDDPGTVLGGHGGITPPAVKKGKGARHWRNVADEIE